MIRFFLVLSLFLSSLVGYAQKPSAIKNDSTRNLKLGLSTSKFIDNQVGPRSQFLVGPLLRYEFELNPNFTLAIHTSYRYAKAEYGFHQLSYGLILQHSLAKLSPKLTQSYFSYGLLSQGIKQENLTNRALAHNTSFALGQKFLGFGKKNFVELSYHISRLNYFNTPETNLDHITMSYGFKF